MAKDPELFRPAEEALWASVGVDTEERWVLLPGGEHVRIQVAGQGPPVVFLHGGSSSGANWAPLVAGMGNFSCLVVDRPGCGLSDPVAGGAKIRDLDTSARFADRFVADVLDALDLARANLVATSFGGYFALRGAAAHPDRVERIVEVTWPMGAPIERAPTSMRFAALPGLGALLTKAPPTRFVVTTIMRQLGLGRAMDAGKVSDEQIDWFLALLRHTDTMANELRANPQIITPIRGMNPEVLFTDELLRRIEAPTLFIWGGEDPMGGAEVAEQFAARFDKATVEVLPLAGHAPWIDEPERCAELAGDFFSGR